LSLLRKLASDTAAYGLSSILARLINYVFSFLIVKAVSTAEYGDYTKFYAYAGFLQVVLTHGMETAYFRFKNKNGHNPKAFATGFFSMAWVSLLFVLLAYLFQEPIARLTRVEQNSEYVLYFAWIMALDTLVALPFASLRAHNKAVRFAVFRIINILIFIFFILLFLFWMPDWYASGVQWAKPLLAFYDPGIGIGYVFLANLIASIITFFMLAGELRQIRFGFDSRLYKAMLPYALPIMLVGFAGMINEMLSRVMMEYLLPYDPVTNKEMLGIFGFNYKFAMLITLFLQAYRYAAEPFFFANANNENAKEVYAKSMHYFIIAGTFIFLGVMVMLPLIQHILLLFDAKYAEYFQGQQVIPVLLAANLTLGIYFNLSTWYKVTDKTHIGAMIAIYGAISTFVLNWLLIPAYGDTGAALSTLLCYISMVAVGFIAEQKYYPIPYTYLASGSYIILALVLWLAFQGVRDMLGLNIITTTILSLVLLVIFIAVVYIRESGKLRSRKKLKS